MDVMRVVKYFKYNTVSAVGYGRPFGFLDADKDAYGVTKVMEVVIPPPPTRMALYPLAFSAIFPLMKLF